jgi:DNA-binding CsgD family transcriptional regulator
MATMSSSGRPLTAKLERQILTLYAQGMTRTEVAEECGVSTATVSRVHMRYGIPMRSRGGANGVRLAAREFESTVQLYLAGYSENEIAAFFGITRGGVIWRLDQMKIKRRSISDALRLRAVEKLPMVVILKRRGTKPRLDGSKGKGKR